MTKAPNRNAPIFILGVPRSGTTLLRTLLDSHHAIACGPETPWFGGHQPRSVMELWRFLCEHELGYCASYGMERSAATAAARAMVCTLMERYAASRGKRRWAEKTPDNALYVPFLLELFPEARVIHLKRDGLDVAVSTSTGHRRGISSFLEQNLGFGPDAPPVVNNTFTALLRWSHWNRLIEEGLATHEHLKVSYERLVSEPEDVLREVMRYLGEEYDPAMLDYSSAPHEFPVWEWGSADVKARGAITKERVGRARRELSATELRVLEPLLAGKGPALEHDAPVPDLGADDRLRLTNSYLDSLAGPCGLSAHSDRAGWDAAWLWLHGLSHISWPGKRLVHVGSAHSPLPWAAAMLGAQVSIVDEAGENGLRVLRDGARLPVTWSTCMTEADAVVYSRVALDQAPGMSRMARTLRPGGVLAASWRTRGAAPGWVGKLESELAGAFGRASLAHQDRGGPGMEMMAAAVAVKRA